MAESEHIVNHIRRYMARENSVSASEVEDIAQQYAELVESINDRLDRCVGLLHKGLRTEAIHQASLAPSVLDEVKAVQFDSLERWVSLCHQQNYMVPPAINESAKNELNKALPRHSELTDLLRKHRRLALGRAELWPRIKILRRLSQCDPENSVWGQDLETFEVARHKQIVDEAKSAAGHHDLAKLQALQAQLKEIWLVNPPSHVYEVVAAHVVGVRDHIAREQLGSILERLNAALDQDDETTMRKSLDQWDQCCGQIQDNGAAVDRSVAEIVRGRLQELDSQEHAASSWASSVRAMEHALDERSPMELVERRWVELNKHERAIPQVLRTRYDARCGETAMSSSRRFRLIMLATLGGLIIVGGVIGGMVYWSGKRYEIEQWRHQVVQAIEKEQWSSATELMTQLQQQRPALWQQPVFQGLNENIKVGLASEKSRTMQLNHAVADVESAGVESPDLAAMERAESLAQTSEEKLQVQNLRSVITRAQLAQQQQRDKKFATEFSELRKKFVKWQTQDQAGNADFVMLNTIQDSLNQLLAKPRISESLRTSVEPVAASVAGILKAKSNARNHQQRVDGALAEIQLSTKDPKQLMLALTRFVKQFPNHLLTPQFRRSTEIQSVIDQIVGWNVLIKSFPSFRVKNSIVAQERLVKIDKFCEQFPSGVVLNDELKQYRAYLEQAVKSLGYDGSLGQYETNLNTLLQSPLIDDVWMFQTIDNRNYYTKSAASFEEHGLGMVQITYAANIDQILGNERMLTREINGRGLKLARNGDYLPPSLSPQSEFSQLAKKWLKDSSLPWEMTHLRLIRHVLKNDKIDAILRVAIATRLCKFASEYDWPPSKEIKRLQNIIGAIDTDLQWVDPLDQSVAEARAAIELQLKNLLPLPEVNEVFNQWENKLDRDLGERKFVGLIWSDSKRNFEIQPVPSAVEGMILQVPLRRGGAIQLVTLAHSDAGKLGWDLDIASIPAGSPVYQVTVVAHNE